MQNTITKDLKTTSLNIGFRPSTSKYFIQDFRSRRYENENLFTEISGSSKRFSYNLQATKSMHSNKYSYENSYISYLHKNYVLSLGDFPRWWSSSTDNALLLSNSAPSFNSIGLRNYYPIKFNIPFTKDKSHFSYSLILGHLDDTREIKDAKYFAARISFLISSNFEFSIMRSAQFGGENRSESLETFIDLLLGKDNVSSIENIQEQPGNQLAGFDISVKPFRNKNIKMYTQIIGEDESNKFPSKNFYSAGVNYIYLSKGNLINKFYLDYTDTSNFDGSKNITYNHGLYKDGYRYLKRPIGASIDADSRKLSFGQNIVFSEDLDIDYKFYISELNINNNPMNFYRVNDLSNKGVQLSINYKISESLNLNISTNFIRLKSATLNNDEIEASLGFIYKIF